MQRFLSKPAVSVVLQCFFVAALGILVVTIQSAYDVKNKPTQIQINADVPTYILPEKLLPYLHFGFKNVFADYYWISIIQNSGLSVSDTDLFLHYYGNIGVLDPHFSYPYAFAVLWLPSKKIPGSLEAVVPLAELGMKNNKDNWEIPYYLAFQYQLIGRSFDKTGKYLGIAAAKKDVPLMVQSAYRGYLKRLNRDEDFSEELLKVAYETAESDSLKKYAGNQLLLSYFEKALTKGAKEYKKKYGYFPLDIGELTKKNILVVPPEYGTLFEVLYSNKTGEVSVSLKQ